MVSSKDINKKLDAENSQGWVHVCGPRRGILNVSDAPSLPIKLRGKK